MLLAHPEAEDLGRFVEGTLDDPERTVIVRHIADCDECRVLVVDAAEFNEPAKKESRKWWMGVAASLIIAAGSYSFWYTSRDPRLPMITASSNLAKRPTEARLDGFSYVALNRTRGGSDDDDSAGYKLDEAIANVLDKRGNDPKTLRAKGIAHLLAASRVTVLQGTEPDQAAINEIKSERSNAVAALQAAADRAPNDASYQSDLAAALLTIGDDASRDLALAHLKKALAIDPRNPAALFNEGLALRESNPREAVAVFKKYLDVEDPSSPWVKEARTNIESIEPPP